MVSKDIIYKFLKLSFPILLGFVGQQFIVFGDLLIAGRYSTQAVASIGVASNVLNPFMFSVLALAMGISPVIAFNRGKRVSSEGLLSTILLYGLLAGFIGTVFVIGFSEYILPFFKIKESLIKPTKDYIEIVVWSFPFITAFNTLKEFLQGEEKVILANLITVIAVFFNIFLNYILVFGFWNYPGMGEIGLAWASFLIRLLLFLSLLSVIILRHRLTSLDYKVLKDLFQFNIPLALSTFFEIFAFSLVGILSGRLGVVQAATNNIILTIVSISFMIPMSLGSAAAVKVGNAFGRQDKKDLLSNSLSGYFLVLIVTFLVITLYLVLPGTLIRIISEDKSIISLGVSLFAVVAIFQLVDNTQVYILGVLRGLKLTKIPFFIVISSYWLFGMPLGFWLCFYRGYDLLGLWIGLAVSLLIVCFGLLFYLRFKFQELPKLFAQKGS